MSTSQLRKVIAGSVTVAVVLGAIMLASVLRGVSGGPAQTPEECVQRMLNAMEAADVESYLDCYTGELRQRLQRTADEQGRDAFAQYLKRTAAPIKGCAILHDKTQWSGNDKVRIVVDRVYENRPWEYQAYRLKRERDGWRIYAVEPAEPHKPPIPWGTPAIPLPKEMPKGQQKGNQPAGRSGKS